MDHLNKISRGCSVGFPFAEFRLSLGVSLSMAQSQERDQQCRNPQLVFYGGLMVV